MKRALFLGTGASTGIPVIGCPCAVCHSTDQRDQRLRPSLLLEINDKKILIDAGPDFRAQALHYHIDHLDGVLITHAHSDHVAGLDELRIYYLRTGKKIPLLASKETMQELKRRYNYLFDSKEKMGNSLTAQIEPLVLEERRGEILFCEIPLRYFSYEQGGMQVTGFRYEDFAYVVDLRHYPESLFEDLHGVDTIVLSALGPFPSQMHLSFEEAIAFVKKVGARRCYLTHLSHKLTHIEAEKLLPEFMHLAYDGLIL